jgi:uncharacterized protein (DUF302 family)
MSEDQYCLRRELPDLEFDDAVARVTELLKDQGFGVLTEIDVKHTLKQKLNVDVHRYLILGACNPQLAHQALDAEPGIGVLLPCNVVVAEGAAGGTVIRAMDPVAAFELIDNPDVKPVAGEVRDRLQRVLDHLP